jgi:hypothetical protein
MHSHFLSSFHRRGLSLLLLLMAMNVFAGRCFGQAQNTGEVSGTVVDTAHALIPGAEVTLTSEDRGTVLNGKTNASGGYVFNDVAVGSYTLKISAPGFSAFVSPHVTVNSDTRLRVDAALKPGSVDAEVIVNANAVTVDTQTATIQQVIDNELVENLPVDGNNIVALAAILPGVTNVVAPNTFTDENGGPTLVANGARSTSNLFLFDGLLWNNLYLNTGINYPNHAVISQVSVQLNNFSAQYGRNAGSIFNVVSKGGGNTIHGQAFLHVENSIFNAQNYFSNSKPPQATYQFGGAIGGAIKKDKLFYEAEYQSLIGHSANQGDAETFTNAERGLNPDGTPRACISPQFAGLTCASFAADAVAGASIATLVYNPIVATSNSSFGTNPSVAIGQLQSTWLATGHTGTSPCLTLLGNLGAGGYMPNAEVPSPCFDPVIQNVINRGYIPLPTATLGTGQYQFAVSQTPRPQREFGGFLRGDWVITPRHSLELRYYHTDNSDFTANGSTNQSVGVTTYGVDSNAAYITAGSIGETAVLTPNIVNVAKVGYKRYDYEVIPTDTTTLGGLGANYTYPGFQSLPIINVNTRFRLGSTSAAYTHSVNQNIEAFDNLSFVHGNHNLQVGVDYLRLQYLKILANPGTFNFYGNPGYTYLQASDAIMGLLYSESVGNETNIAAIQHALYTYAQDTWRATSRLTLTLGVRYELPWMWYQPDGKAATFIRGYQSVKFPNAPAGEAFVGDSGVPRSLTPTDYSNVSPRVGIVYDVFGNGKTAIRAGFGTFYDAIPATIVGATEPFTYSAFYQAPSGSITDPLLGEPAIPSPYSGGAAQFTSPYSIIYPDRNFKNSYTIGVNFGFQQQINKSAVLEADYIGRYSRHQMIPLDQNQAITDCNNGAYEQANPTLYCPSNLNTYLSTYAARVRFPGYNYGGQGVVDLISAGTANYNAFQIVYRQRAFKGLTALANYTYSRTIDEQTSLSVSNSTPTPDNIVKQYAPSDQNATQIFNIGFSLRSPRVRSGSAWMNAALNNWNFNGIYNARSGLPVNLTFGGDESGTDEPNQRVYQIPGMSATLPTDRHRKARIQEWFNIAAFQKPAIGTWGNVGRNSIIGPSYISANLSIMRDVSLNRYREGMHAQFRAESFNLFNTINLGQPNSVYSAGSTTFGSVTSAGSNPNRRVQFGLIVYF